MSYLMRGDMLRHPRGFPAPPDERIVGQAPRPIPGYPKDVHPDCGQSALQGVDFYP